MAQQKQYDDTNRGVLFNNDRKQKQTHPDYKGTINVKGEEFWLSGWIKQGKKGDFISLSVEPKEPKQDQYSRDQGSSYSREEDDEPPY